MRISDWSSDVCSSDLTRRRNRITAGEPSDMPITCSKSGRSLCQPMPAPMPYSMINACSSVLASRPAKAAATAQRFEPSWQRIAGGKSAGLEIIGPAEGACPPFALPLLELERRQVGGCDAGNQLSLFSGRDEIVAVSRSEEHQSELQSIISISYAVFCLKQKKTTITTTQ